MSDFPPSSVVYPKGGVLSNGDLACSELAVMQILRNALVGGSVAWGTANRAIYVPVQVEVPCQVYKMSVLNQVTVAGNLDLGIYNEKGVQLVAKGSTAQSGASVVQTLDITDTFLMPGVYYLAMATDSTTATYFSWTVTALSVRTCGVREQTSAFALPATATFAAFAGTFVPYIWAHYVTTV